MTDLFWLSDEQWKVISPFMPARKAGLRREDDRRIISGILHVVKTNCAWAACPSEYGRHMTVYTRFNAWSRRAFWKAMRSALARAGWTREAAALDFTSASVSRMARR